jgi:hypothetical protein
MLGSCRLCLREEVELQDSHILPKWAYRRLRDDEGGGNPNPFVISETGVTQTSAQVKEYLLCRPCEQLLSKDEKYVAERADSRTGRSPLLAQIREQRHSFTDSGDLHEYGVLPDLDGDAIARFASSVVWRSYVSSHRKSGGVRLTPEYAESIRKWLVGEAPQPKEVAVILAVLDPTDPNAVFDKTASLPHTVKYPDVHGHRLVVCGLLFEVCVGKRMPLHVRRFCVARGPRRIIGLIPESRSGLLQTFRVIARSHALAGR